MSEANKALIRKLLDGADANDVGVLHEVLATDYVDHNPPPFQGPERPIFSRSACWAM